MDRNAWRVLLCLGLGLVLLPLALAKPGLPTSLKADESAYYLMALSLAHDQDLRVDTADVDRAFADFPFRPVANLIVMSDDGWRTTYFGKPFVYSLLAAPLARLWGANGLLAWNMLLLVGMIAMGAQYLARYNSATTALLFSCAFFLLSTAFGYAFWLQPEVFNMAAVAACLFAGFRSLDGGAGGSTRGAALAAFASASALALGTYNKPVIALIGVPILAAYCTRRQWRLAAVWLAGAASVMAALAGISLVLTGHASSYLGVVRRGVTLCEPGRLPIAPEIPVEVAGTNALPAAAAPAPDADAEASGAEIPPAAPAASAPAPPPAPTTNAWSWIFRIPPITLGEFLENLGYFFIGRHTGLLLYLPFAAIATFLFLAGDGRRSRRRWLLLLSIGGVALFFLTAVFFNWHGGGGFLGNRYFVAAYPGFLFLVTRIRWHWPVALGCAWGGFCLGPLLLSPFGAMVPEPTLQAHVRNAPFRYFPLELSLRNVPGYDRLLQGDVRLLGRRDVFLPRGDGAWLRGGDAVEVWIQSERPITEAFFEVASGAPNNHLRLRLEDARAEIDFAAIDESRRIALRPSGPGQVRTQWGGTFFVYKLVAETTQARIRSYTREQPPNSCPYFPEPATTEEIFPMGVALTYLGDGDPAARDLYAISWGAVSAPAEVTAGQSFSVPVELWNRSAETWSPHGAARVRLAYHWLLPDGSVAVRDGVRTELAADVPPGQRVGASQTIVAPTLPGDYVLELDPVYETTAWFSDRNGGATVRRQVRVVAP